MQNSMETKRLHPQAQQPERMTDSILVYLNMDLTRSKNKINSLSKDKSTGCTSEPCTAFPPRSQLSASREMEVDFGAELIICPPSTFFPSHRKLKSKKVR